MNEKCLNLVAAKRHAEGTEKYAEKLQERKEIKAEAKMKMREEAAAKVRAELERERLREIERRGSFVG